MLGSQSIIFLPALMLLPEPFPLPAMSFPLSLVYTIPIHFSTPSGEISSREFSDPTLN
jgi:hypothetical protein